MSAQSPGNWTDLSELTSVAGSRRGEVGGSLAQRDISAPESLNSRRSDLFTADVLPADSGSVGSTLLRCSSTRAMLSSGAKAESWPKLMSSTGGFWTPAKSRSAFVPIFKELRQRIAAKLC